MQTITMVEARCPNCSKVAKVMAEDGQVFQTAFCPPSIKHRRYVAMRPGAKAGNAQVAARKARTA
ncbi:hypothetical protein D3C83_207190 [compost metagenome]